METEPTAGLFIALLLVTVWQVFWKGVALWHASKSHQKKWFIFLVMLSPLTATGLDLFGIVDLVYLFFFAKQPLTLHEITKWFKKKTH